MPMTDALHALTLAWQIVTWAFLGLTAVATLVLWLFVVDKPSWR